MEKLFSLSLAPIQYHVMHFIMIFKFFDKIKGFVVLFERFQYGRWSSLQYCNRKQVNFRQQGSSKQWLFPQKVKYWFNCIEFRCDCICEKKIDNELSLFRLINNKNNNLSFLFLIYCDCKFALCTLDYIPSFLSENQFKDRVKYSV